VLKEFIKPSCPIDVSKRLGMHEQKVYYYVRRFIKLGLLKEVDREQRHGTVAKFYKISKKAYAFIVDHDFKNATWVKKPSIIFEPFIKEGRQNFKIVVGSPDPHGPFNARATDATCAIDLALYLGTFMNHANSECYKLDTEVKEKELRENLIVVGGPSVNMVTKAINKHMDIYFDMGHERDIVSKISGKRYVEDEIGIANLIKNPFNKNKKIIVLAGKRFQGTMAAVVAFIRYPEKILHGNKFRRNSISHVVRGLDLNGDGRVDDAEIIE